MSKSTDGSADLRAETLDAEWYVKTYPDVAMLGMDARTHYLTYGREMGRLPNDGSPVDLQKPDTFPVNPLASRLISESVAAYKGIILPISTTTAEALPKVSVIMTAHNAEQTIARAIESMIFQTWPNLEVIVVDDASTDRTWQEISSIVSNFKKCIKAIRLEENMGTYLAKNIGILKSVGEIVMFQDSDDYSHPDRVAIQASHLVANPSLLGNRTKYCRYNFDTGLVIPVSGTSAKFGLITLALRRSLFDKVGFFDAVRRAGDDEWFERARMTVGRNVFANLDVAMYMAEYRQNSLAQDLFVSTVNNGIEQTLSGDRAEYSKSYKSRHAATSSDTGRFRTENPPVPKVAPLWVPVSMAAIPRYRMPVIATMCSIPSRISAMKKAVRSVIDQVDHLHIYLDRYEKIPDFLDSDPRITVIRSQSIDKDLRDNAKFLPYNSVISELDEFFFLTLDDGISYPRDYVFNHLSVSKSFKHRCVTGVHGVMYEETPSNYFDRRFVFHYRKDLLSSHILVNSLGTGTTGFHSSCFASINPLEWQRGGMVDVYFSILAKSRNVPMLCIARTPNWLTDVEESAGAPTLYDEFKTKDGLIVAELEQHVPWGYQAISETLASLPEQERLGLVRHMPPFADRIKVGSGLQR